MLAENRFRTALAALAVALPLACDAGGSVTGPDDRAPNGEAFTTGEFPGDGLESPSGTTCRTPVEVIPDGEESLFSEPCSVPPTVPCASSESPCETIRTVFGSPHGSAPARSREVRLGP